MKASRIIFSILMLIVFTCSHCQSQQPKPEKVQRIVYEMKPDEWYDEQAKLWKKELEKNPNNPDAWVNYYNANRYAHFVDIGTAEKKVKLNKIIEDMEQAIPGTYECYVLKHRNEHNLWDISLIEKAYALDPNRHDIYDEFVSHYEATGNEKKMKEVYTKWYYSKDINPNLLNYNYNVLMSTEENAVLVTNGDNDTYPARMLQVVKGIREDVTILNISLSTVESYFEHYLGKRGIKIDFKSIFEKAKDIDPSGNKSFSQNKFIQELAKTIAAQHPDIPVYFALTVYDKRFAEIKDDLYIVGLAYRYSPERIDNLALLKKNIEKNFRLNYLKYDWYVEEYPGNRSIAHLNMNYVAPMIMLAEHYKTSGEDAKARAWKNWALEIAEKADNKKVCEDIEKKGL